jgi:hypothetical protein
LKRTLSICGVLLAACLSFVATAPALAAFNEDDVGLAAMASRAVQSIEDVPFAGGYDELNGYSWPKARAFQLGYPAALQHGLPASYLSNRPWMKTFDGPTSPNELFRFNGTTVFFKHFCQAHNCGGNEVYVLYDLKTNKVWGASTTFSPTAAYVFGKPNAEQAALLLALLARDVGGMMIPLNEKETTPSTFPLSGNLARYAREYIVRTRGNVAYAAASIITAQLGN